MLTTLLYLFTFSSWGMGLLAALVALSMRLQEHSIKIKAANMELQSKTRVIETLMGGMSGPRIARKGDGIPEELQNLMKSSPDHPEVNEIEEGDEVFGIVFQSHNYPPAMESNDEQDS